MKKSSLFLIYAIATAMLLLVLASAGSFYVGMVMAKSLEVGIPLMGLLIGLVFLMFVFLAEDIDKYQMARKDERQPDQHDWPYWVGRKGYQKFDEPGSSVTIRKS